MNDHTPPPLDEYYRESASWNQDRVTAATRSRRIAWYVASAAAVIALLEAAALVVLLPLKTVVPYTLMVDRTTGYVQALKPGEPATVSPDSALTQSFLVQYVTAREGYDIATLQANYRKVSLMSAEGARASYLSRMQAANPESPINAYPRDTTIEVRVKSVSPVGRDTAFVRFETVRIDANGQIQPAAPWVAVVRYRYSNAPMRLEDRFVNPLGFHVLHYRRDAEALPATPLPQPVGISGRAVPTSAPGTQPVVAIPSGSAAPANYYQGQRR